MARKRCTKKEQFERISAVQGLLVKGHDYTAIIRFCMKEYKVSDSQAKRYIKEARSMVKLTVDGLMDQLDYQYARLLSELHNNEKDVNAKLKIHDQIRKVLELRAKISNKENRGDTATSTSSLPDEDTLASLLKEIENDEAAE